jgi:transposase InsO family protein
VIAQVSQRGLFSVAQASAWFGITRQAYYAACQRAAQRALEEHLLLELVLEVRQRHPRMGARKLLHKVQPALHELGIAYGRDAFFDLLRAHELLVPPKRRQTRTTQRAHYTYPNRLTELPIERVHQVWVADITYLTTEQHFLYLALLTDAYSRFIVAYDLSASLAMEGCERALRHALAQTPPTAVVGLIHHSDHGMQYSAGRYADHLRRHGMQASMGAVGNCYDNAIAERVNGILKDEYGLDARFVDERQARQAVPEAIDLYNHERPHLALHYATPAEVHFAT